MIYYPIPDPRNKILNLIKDLAEAIILKPIQNLGAYFTLDLIFEFFPPPICVPVSVESGEADHLSQEQGTGEGEGRTKG